MLNSDLQSPIKSKRSQSELKHFCSYSSIHFLALYTLKNKGSLLTWSHDKPFTSILHKGFIKRVNYLNEEYCDVFVPGGKLKTTMEAFQGVQKQWH